MKTILILMTITPILLLSNRIEPKIMHGQNYHRNYEHSTITNNRDDNILLSTFDATGQISVAITVEVTSEITTQITSEGNRHSTARLSYLDNNRVEITEDIARGEGEHLETLLSIMNLKKDSDSLKVIQNNFDKLIYLSHNNFLDKLENLVEQSIS